MSQVSKSHTVAPSRLAGLLATGLIAGLPLLFAGPALAAAPQVEFSGGGLGLLACGSRPSTGEVTVAAESTVTFVNRLSQGATLRVNGRDSKWVPQNSGIKMLFHRGPVEITMVPDCTLNLSKSFDPVSVNVISANDGTAPSASPSGSGSSVGGGNGTGQGATPNGYSRGNGTSGTAGTRSPDGSGQQSPSGAPITPADGGVNSANPGTVEKPAASSGQGLAAEPVAAAQAAGGGGPNGLLALIATVCVVGVSAGAIRAIAAQRATRTGVA
jgi:hypothetical protein